jgi:hypothetical protein
MPDENASRSWNPLLAEVFPSFSSLEGPSASTFGWFTFATFNMMYYPDKIAAFNRKGASWRRMLVQQPPLPEFAFF